MSETKAGNKVSIFGFGTFSPSARAARMGRNPADRGAGEDRRVESVRLRAGLRVQGGPQQPRQGGRAKKAAPAKKATAKKARPAKKAAPAKKATKAAKKR